MGVKRPTLLTTAVLRPLSASVELTGRDVIRKTSGQPDARSRKVGELLEIARDLVGIAFVGGSPQCCSTARKQGNAVVCQSQVFNGKAGYVILMFVYGDESMDETCSRVCAVAGVVGTEAEWQAIEPIWTERNAGIPFHAKNCESDQGDYKVENHAENQILYRDLVTIIARSYLSGYAVATNLGAEKMYYPDTPLIYLRGFYGVIAAMRWWAQQHGEIAECCFDNRVESEFNAALLYANLRELDPNWKPYLADKISFESSQGNPRIQVADLFAREAMKNLDNRIGPVKREPRKSWVVLRDTGRFEIEEQDENFFASEKREWDSRLNVDNIRFSQYREWLSSTGRQHSLSNTIWFFGRNLK
jgi:hypothetical protein